MMSNFKYSATLLHQKWLISGGSCCIYSILINVLFAVNARIHFTVVTIQLISLQLYMLYDGLDFHASMQNYGCSEGFQRFI